MRAGSTLSTVTGTTRSFTHTWLMATFSPTIAFSAMSAAFSVRTRACRAKVDLSHRASGPGSSGAVHANAPQVTDRRSTEMDAAVWSLPNIGWRGAHGRKLTGQRYRSIVSRANPTVPRGPTAGSVH